MTAGLQQQQQPLQQEVESWVVCMILNETVAGRERILWFLGIGALASVADIGLLWIFCDWFGIWYLSAAVLSYCCGILISYLLNKGLTFHDRDRHYIRQLGTFAAISFSCLLMNVVIIWLLVTFFSWNYLAAKILATICAVFWNYYGQSTITFGTGQASEKKEGI
jgi:putative flippase GtrA